MGLTNQTLCVICVFFVQRYGVMVHFPQESVMALWALSKMRYGVMKDPPCPPQRSDPPYLQSMSTAHRRCTWVPRKSARVIFIVNQGIFDPHLTDISSWIILFHVFLSFLYFCPTFIFYLFENEKEGFERDCNLKGQCEIIRVTNFFLIFPPIGRGGMWMNVYALEKTKIVERGGLESLFKSVFELFSSVKTQSRDSS